MGCMLLGKVGGTEGRVEMKMKRKGEMGRGESVKVVNEIENK